MQAYLLIIEAQTALSGRAVKDSADAYAELMNKFEQNEPLGQLQAEKGCLYQVKGAGLMHEIK